MSSVRIVLVGTSHPGNIGAAARAMKTMGLTQLSLVAPHLFPNAQATARAAGADDLLQTAQIFPTLPEAIADCHLVIGSSARARHIAWPRLDAREAGRLAARRTMDSAVAFVFGNERVGLTNAELDHCHCLVHIPTRADYSSLNLAAAVQVIAYEVQMATRAMECEGEGTEAQEAVAAGAFCVGNTHVPAPTLEMERLYAHIEQTLIDVAFLDPVRPRLLMRRLRRLFHRAQPDIVEVNILRGILTAVQQQMKKGSWEED